MKTKQKLILLGAAMTSLLFSSCVGTYDDGEYGGGYSGPYYGDYGPYYGGGFYGYGDDLIVGGRRHRGSFGDHHISGHSFGGGSHSGSGFSSARSAAGHALSGSGHSGGGGHSGGRSR